MPLLPARRDERTPERWEPFAHLEDVRRQMDRVFDELMGGAPAVVQGDAWSPLVDVEETDDAWIIEADVPGAKREDIDVELHDDELTIRGEVKERERVGMLRRRTRRTGQFDYRVRVPGDLDENAIEAKLDDGVLTVRVPKGERTRPRRIQVTTG
jgi:HSP20 family protein